MRIKHRKVNHNESDDLSLVDLIRMLASFQALFRAVQSKRWIQEHIVGHGTLLHCHSSEAIGIFNHSETSRKRHVWSVRSHLIWNKVLTHR